MKESSKNKWANLEKAFKVGKSHKRLVHVDENGDPIYLEPAQLKEVKHGGVTEVTFFEAVDLTKE